MRPGVQPPGHLSSGRIDCSTVEPRFFDVLDLPQFEKDLAIGTDAHLIEHNAYPYLMEEQWIERLNSLAKQYHMTEVVEMLEQ